MSDFDQPAPITIKETVTIRKFDGPAPLPGEEKEPVEVIQTETVRQVTQEEFKKLFQVGNGVGICTTDPDMHA